MPNRRSIEKICIANNSFKHKKTFKKKNLEENSPEKKKLNLKVVQLQTYKQMVQGDLNTYK